LFSIAAAAVLIAGDVLSRNPDSNYFAASSAWFGGALLLLSTSVITSLWWLLTLKPLLHQIRYSEEAYISKSANGWIWIGLAATIGTGVGCLAPGMGLQRLIVWGFLMSIPGYVRAMKKETLPGVLGILAVHLLAVSVAANLSGSSDSYRLIDATVWWLVVMPGVVWVGCLLMTGKLLKQRRLPWKTGLTPVGVCLVLVGLFALQSGSDSRLRTYQASEMNRFLKESGTSAVTTESDTVSVGNRSR
jgi:hypothetical protein